MKRCLILVIFLLLISSAPAIAPEINFDNQEEVSVIVILKEKPIKQKFDVDKAENKKIFLEQKRAAVKEQQDKVLNKLEKKSGFGIQSKTKKENAKTARPGIQFSRRNSPWPWFVLCRTGQWQTA